MSKKNEKNQSNSESKVEGTKETAVAKNKKKTKGFINEFKEFAVKGNAMSMAIGVLIGGAFSGIVTSFTNNILNPVLNCFGKVDSSDVAKLAIKVKGQSIEIGAFLADIVNFLIVAFVVFLLVRGMNALANIGKKEEKPAPKTKKCPYCKSEIAIDAVKCPHCTSDVE
ncbi:MAG: large conductance mechanosensitive channel protein MscL [Lachnospiraceae bacterium]|nr:large conductance mechanosensitive channel protein MscL [Lachnospiraceae bacterium]